MNDFFLILKAGEAKTRNSLEEASKIAIEWDAEQVFAACPSDDLLRDVTEDAVIEWFANLNDVPPVLPCIAAPFISAEDMSKKRAVIRKRQYPLMEAAE